MRSLMVLCFLVFAVPGGPAFADRAVDGRTGKEIDGLFVSATGKGFNFRIECYGPVKFIPWGSPKNGSGSTYTRTTSCRTLPVGLTAGADSGGECENWRDGRVLRIGFLKMKGYNWRYATALNAKKGKISFRAFNGDIFTGSMKKVGIILVNDGACLEGGGIKRGSYSGVPRSFRIKR